MMHALLNLEETSYGACSPKFAYTPKTMMHNDACSPRIMMNTEGKVPKKASLNRTCAKSASWRRVESIGTHTVCANFLLTAHSVY